MTTTKQFTGIYERVSTKDQSFAMQHLQLQRWCKAHSIPCSKYKWYRDKASGKNSHRPELQRLLRHVQQGRVKTLVIYSLQRLSRSLLDGVKLLTTLLENDVEVVSLSEKLELKGCSGRLVLHVLLSIYQYQREFQNEMIRNGVEARRKAGKPIGRPRNDKRLLKIRKWRDKGLSAVEISSRLGCSRANVYALLQRTG